MYLNVTHHGYCYRCKDQKAIRDLCRFLTLVGPDSAAVLDALLASQFEVTRQAS